MGRLRRLGLRAGMMSDDEAFDLIVAPRPAITDAHIDRYQRWAIARHGSEAGGRLAGWFRGIVTDWRERRQADEKLREGQP